MGDQTPTSLCVSSFPEPLTAVAAFLFDTLVTRIRRATARLISRARLSA